MASVAAALCCSSLAFAAGDSDDGKVSGNAQQKAYIEKLEARIRALEKKEERFRLLEKKIDILNQKLATREAGSGWHGPIVTGRGNKPPKAGGNATDNTTTADQPSTTAQQSNAAATNTNGAPTQAALADKDDTEALHNLTVIRDQAVTVKKGGLEVGFNVKYIRATTYQQFSRAVIGTGSIRYGILPGVEATLVVPAYLATRRTEIGPTDEFVTDIKSVGDISGQLTASLFKETIDWPGVFGYVAVTAPTGPDPYWVEPGQTPYPQPINPLYFTQSSGHWNGTVGVTVVKTLEPIIMFGGLSYTHYLPRDFAGSTIQPADRYGYNFGFGLAVSERTMIGASVQGIIQKNIVMDGIPRLGSSAEAVILTFSLSQRFGHGYFFEPSVALGLTNDAPAATVGAGVRKTF